MHTLSFISRSWDCMKRGHRAGDMECMYSVELNKPRGKMSTPRRVQVAFSVEKSSEDHDNRSDACKPSKLQGRRDDGNRSGLEETIMEMLTNYEPTSAQHKPFWCRVCRFQGASLDEYEEHMRSDFHRGAKQMERELSTCKLCKKEFTSPDQLREHKRGKAHREKLENHSHRDRRKRPRN